MKEFKNSLRCGNCLNTNKFHRNVCASITFNNIEEMNNLPAEDYDWEWAGNTTCYECDSEDIEKYEHLTRKSLEKLISANLINITYKKLDENHVGYDKDYSFMLLINGYEYDTISDPEQDHIPFILEEHNEYGRDILEYITTVKEALGYSNE